MIISAVLGNPDHPEYGVATIPFPIPKDEYAHSIGLLEQLEVGDPIKRDCKLVEIDGWPKVLNRLCGKTINVDEMDYLAKRLDSFDVYEAAQYQGTVFEHNLQDMTDLINQTFCCQQATVVTNFSDLEKVGKDHYLTLMGGSCPMKDYEQVDGVETALLLLDSGEGKVTPYGVVYDNLMKMEQLYDGVRFPGYLYDRPELILRMTPLDSPDKTGFLYLPMPKEQMARIMQRNGGIENCEVEIENWHLSDKVLSIATIPNAGHWELNDMCQAISQLDENDRHKLDATIDMAQPEYPEQITQLALNLGLFDFFPGVSNAKEYGIHLIQESGHYSFDAELENYYNYEACGHDQMSSESGQFTEQGYIAYHGELSLDELMAEDPTERYQREQGMEMGGMV